MTQITKTDLEQALRDWEKAREKALMLQDKLGGFLRRKHEQIKLDQEKLARSQITDGWSHQVAKHNPDYAATFDQAALTAALKDMEDRAQAYLDLKEKFIGQQQP